MSGRRSHVRFDVVQCPEGVLRVMHDVVVQRAGRDEVIAMSREPGVLGEAVTVEVRAHATHSSVRARIVESLPLMVSGHVRHRLRLHTLGEAS